MGRSSPHRTTHLKYCTHGPWVTTYCTTDTFVHPTVCTPRRGPHTPPTGPVRPVVPLSWRRIWTDHLPPRGTLVGRRDPLQYPHLPPLDRPVQPTTTEVGKGRPWEVEGTEGPTYPETGHPMLTYPCETRKGVTGDSCRRRCRRYSRYSRGVP